MSYERVVVGTDGSPTAHLAVEAAARLAASCRAQLVVATAADRDAGRVLEEGARVAAGAGLQAAESEAGAGKPPEVLAGIARRLQADLVVVGSKGLTGGARRFLGSVADRLAGIAPCDLLVVRTSRALEAERRGGYRSVLVATDGSSTADRACLRAIDFARTVGAGLTMLYVGFPATGEQILEETIGRMAGPMPVQRLVVEGDPAERIVEAAERQDADVVLVGNRGLVHGPVFGVGVVPRKVMRTATRDVLIARTASLEAAELAPGEGTLLSESGTRLAVYRTDDGELITMSARCQHLGCDVGWNATERTWDCPCHGSRYQADGSVLNGPTTKPLVRIVSDEGPKRA